MTTKTNKTNKTTTKKFNPKRAGLAEINRELKRLASRKCRAKDQSTKDQYQKEYEELVKIKNDRFKSTKAKSYLTYSDDEIKNLDLETTIKGIKSLQSTRCIYPDRKNEVLKVEAKFQDHKNHLMELAQFEALKAKLGK